MPIPTAPRSDRPLAVGEAVRRARGALVATRPEDGRRCEHIEGELRSALATTEASADPRARAAGAAIRTACAHLGAGQIEDAFIALDAAQDRLGPR